MPQTDDCPVCRKSLLADERHREDYEAHVAACLETRLAQNFTLDESSPEKCPPVHKNHDQKPHSKAGHPANSKCAGNALNGVVPTKKDDSQPPSSAKLTKEKSSSVPNEKNVADVNGNSRPNLFQRLTSKLGAETKSLEEKQEKADDLMTRRWGPPGSPIYELAMKYWIATRMQQHWEYLRAEHPRRFKRSLQSGYMEPVSYPIPSNQISVVP